MTWTPEQSHKHTSFGQAVEELSADDAAAVEARSQSLQKLFADRPLHALFKIEVHFGKGRSSIKPFAGAVLLYRSGTKLHGGGDELVYQCWEDSCLGVVMPEAIGKGWQCADCGIAWANLATLRCPQCRAPIPPEYKPKDIGVCSDCKTLWPGVPNKSEQGHLVSPKLFMLTAQNWATVIRNYFERTKHHADIYLKFHPTDIRSASATEIINPRGGELLDGQVRSRRGLHIYPLKNIIKDVSNGSDLTKRFYSFITA